MEPEQELSKPKTPSTVNHTHRKRPVTGVPGKPPSSRGVNKMTRETKDDISMEMNGFHGGVQSKPRSGHTPRVKEVGKVKPMRIVRAPLNKSEEDFDKKEELRKNQQNSLTDSINQEEIKDDEDDDLSLIEERPKHSDELAVIKQPSIDPTKDFYSTTGRPVSPVLPFAKPDTSQEQPSNMNDADAGNNKLTDSKDQEPLTNRPVSHDIKVTPALLTKPQPQSTGESSERVKVIVRSRPISEKEMANGHEWYEVYTCFLLLISISYISKSSSRLAITFTHLSSIFVYLSLYIFLKRKVNEVDNVQFLILKCVINSCYVVLCWFIRNETKWKFDDQSLYLHQHPLPRLWLVQVSLKISKFSHSTPFMTRGEWSDKSF